MPSVWTIAGLPSTLISDLLPSVSPSARSPLGVLNPRGAVKRLTLRAKVRSVL